MEFSSRTEQTAKQKSPIGGFLFICVRIMGMKKVIVVVVIIAAGVLFYSMRDKSPIKIEVPATSENGDFHPDPSNATFIFYDGPITLSAGRSEIEIVPGNALVEETILMDKFAYGDINADSKEDTVLLLARYGAGSGTFIYVAAFVSGPVTYKGSEAIYIGDRISPQNISINKGIVTVEYLDRKIDEALAAEPTVPTTKQFVYKNREFQER